MHSINQERLGSAIWSDLDHAAANSASEQERGRAAFDLFLCYSLGQYAPSNGIHEALEYITSAAIAEYGPAFIAGRRMFEANNVPVPEVLHRGPQDPELRNSLSQLEHLPNEEYYSAAVRTFWPPKLRHDAMESLAELSDGLCAIDLVPWIQDQNRQMGSVKFQAYAQKHFLFHHSVGNGSYIACETLLLLGCDANIQTPDGTTPLHLACRCAEVEIIRLLLRHGADASLNDNENVSPLHWLVLLPKNDIRQIADMLLGQFEGAKSVSVSRSRVFFDDLGIVVSGTALSWAIDCRNLAVVKVLTDLGVTPLLDPSCPADLLAKAVGIGCAKVTEYLLQLHDFRQGLSAEEEEETYRHLGSRGSCFTRWLMHGSSCDKTIGEVIDVLERFGFRLALTSADLIKPDTFTPLCRAIIGYHIPVIKELLWRGASVNDRCAVHTALGWAIRSGDSFGPRHKVTEVVKLLLDHGANTEPEPCLRVACASEVPVDVFRLLITASPTDIKTTYHGTTPLLELLSCDIKDEVYSKVQILVQAGADLDVETPHSKQPKNGVDCCLTALAHSLDNLEWGVAKYLLERGATIEFGVSTGHRHTVLHLLVYKAFRTHPIYGQGETETLIVMTRNLLAHPIAKEKDLINILNYDGVSALKMAVFFGLSHIVQIFLERRHGISKQIVADVSSMVRNLTPENAPPFVVADGVEPPKNPGGNSRRYAFSDYKRRMDGFMTMLETFMCA